MAASDWAALVIGIAGVIAGLVSTLPTMSRKPAMGACAVLIVIAVTIAVIGSKIRTQPKATPTTVTSVPASNPPTRISGSAVAKSPIGTGSAVPPNGQPAGTPLAGPNDNSPGGTIVGLGNEDDLNTDATGIGINGNKFNDSFKGRCNAFCPTADTAWLEFDLSRKYKQFKATFGISDDSQSSTDSSSIEVIADGKIIYDRSFKLGEGQSVDLNVTDVLRLRIEFTGSLATAYPAVGDPTIYQ